MPLPDRLLSPNCKNIGSRMNNQARESLAGWGNLDVGQLSGPGNSKKKGSVIKVKKFAKKSQS